MKWLTILRAVAFCFFVISIAIGYTAIRSANENQRWTGVANAATLGALLAERDLQFDRFKARSGDREAQARIADDLIRARHSVCLLTHLGPDARTRSILSILSNAIDTQLRGQGPSRHPDVMPMAARMEELRTLLRQQGEARAGFVHLLERLLGGLMVVLMLILFGSFAAQRLGTRTLKAQAANERLSAAIATPLIDAGPGPYASRMKESAKRFALYADARRLQLLLPKFPNETEFSWPAEDADPHWVRNLVDAADVDDAWVDDRVVASRTRSGPGGALGQAMAEADVGHLVLLRVIDPFRVLLGFEPADLSVVQRRDQLAGLTAAIVAIAHGARREVMQLERERLERELTRARRMETIGAMASGVAHNFNNILGAIGGFAEMGHERTRAGTRARASFVEIQGAVKRANDLIEDILTFSRRKRAKKQLVNLSDVLQQTMRLLSATPGAEGDFELVLDGDHRINGAEGDLQQVFLNICNNARDASHEGPVTITVRSHRLIEKHHMSHGSLYPGTYVVVSIRDSGPGVPEMARRRLFEPFFTTKPAGTGLGLSTAWEIVQDHGGTIDVDDHPLGGGLFAVWLPQGGSSTGATPDVQSRAHVLVFAEPSRLAAKENMLLELGFEPICVSLATEANDLFDLVQEADAVLIETWRTSVAELLIQRIAPALGARALLLAIPERDTLAITIPSRRLDYPLRSDQLAQTLTFAR